MFQSLSLNEFPAKKVRSAFCFRHHVKIVRLLYETFLCPLHSVRSIYKCPISPRCNERKKAGLKKLIRRRNEVKREEWNLYILKRGVSLGAECLKEKTKDLQITVSTREYPYQKNRISYISWLTYYTKCRKIHKQKQQRKKEITNTKHPNQLNTETKKDS